MKGSVEKEVILPRLVSEGLPKVSVAVLDRVLLHLDDHEAQADRYVVGSELTRPGIAEACAQHPPNVSRAMRTLLKDGAVDEHTRSIRGEERRQKTWQLSETGRQRAAERRSELGQTKILLRNNEGELLEVHAKEAAERLEADISLLQILLHAQHEGVLTYGDIRFGRIQKSDDALPAPGRLTPMTGAHATYNNPFGWSIKLRKDSPHLLTSAVLRKGPSSVCLGQCSSHWEDNAAHSSALSTPGITR